MNSFNPIYTIEKLLDEMYRIHMPNLSKQEKKRTKVTVDVYGTFGRTCFKLLSP